MEVVLYCLPERASGDPSSPHAEPDIRSALAEHISSSLEALAAVLNPLANPLETDASSVRVVDPIALRPGLAVSTCRPSSV